MTHVSINNCRSLRSHVRFEWGSQLPLWPLCTVPYSSSFSLLTNTTGFVCFLHLLFHKGAKIMTSFTLANTNQARIMLETRSYIGMAFSEDVLQRVSELYFITIKLPCIKLNCWCFFKKLWLNAEDNILIVLVINIRRLKKSTPMNNWRKVLCASTLPVRCGFLRSNLCNLNLPKKLVRWFSSHGWDYRINQKLTLWPSQWLIIHIYLFIHSTSFIFIASWPLTMNQLTQFSDHFLLLILLTGNKFLNVLSNVILSTSSQIYTHWYYTLC